MGEIWEWFSGYIKKPQPYLRVLKVEQNFKLDLSGSGYHKNVQASIKVGRNPDHFTLKFTASEISSQNSNPQPPLFASFKNCTKIFVGKNNL